MASASVSTLPRSTRNTRSSPPRIGLALAGGGPLGAIWEIGALCALEDSIPGLRLTEACAFVGVSAGGFVAAGLANGIGPRELCRSFIENEGPPGDVFDPAILMRPAWGEIISRVSKLPALAAIAALDYSLGIASRSQVLDRLGRGVPTGLFSNTTVHEHLSRVFSAPGRSNDFRALDRRLVLVAVDLDSGEARPFGMPGHDEVPISLAVQASAALPGLFPPLEIDGRCYVDGALRKTLHASVILDEGLDLLLCLNPLVPYDGRVSEQAGVELELGEAPIRRLVDGGLPQVLSQTFRSMIRSRMELGLGRYGKQYPDTDIVLFEPDPGDASIFFSNPFSYSQRKRMAEHAYQATRAQLRRRQATLGATLAVHGLRLDEAVLNDPLQRLLDTRAAPRGRAQVALRRLDAVLDELDTRLAA
ncbi:patatin-like phospholipase family protein [Rivibacter subsaxonicus]|uniref:Putative acylesterase/phospholipase RssA n=1 Tax=Rivibacter subsaxonicus TaxID=457575 RepID=A0A4Q7VG46_9BURK|nr:patatin-like phospholipase family protein [Rivibacter subsaxonicus]RZT94981.1 putative acylesterase/phospholipase RssA [Rivibacter subsaxonicus]